MNEYADVIRITLGLVCAALALREAHEALFGGGENE